MVSNAKYMRFALTMHIFMDIFFFDWFLRWNRTAKCRSKTALKEKLKNGDDT